MVIRRGFPEVITDVSAGSPRVQQSEYLEQGRYPIVDQGQASVAGYTDAAEALARVDLPIIVFGDHTRRFKFVDRPFAVGADGVKLLKPSADLDAKYAFHYLQSLTLPNAGYSRHFKFLREVDVPLPPLIEQREVVRILDLVDDLRLLRRRSFELLDSLSDTLFTESFGNLVANDRGWPMRRVAEYVAGFQSGRSLVGNRENSPMRVLKISAVTSGVLDLSQTKPLPADYVPPTAHLVAQGDLLFSRANTSELVGATAYVDRQVERLALPDKLWKFIWQKPVTVDPIFAWKAFSRPEVRSLIGDRATGSGGSMKNVTQAAVLSLQFGMPSYEEQQQFVGRMADLREVGLAQRSHLARLDEIYSSLEALAFRTKSLPATDAATQ